MAAGRPCVGAISLVLTALAAGCGAETRTLPGPTEAAKAREALDTAHRQGQSLYFLGEKFLGLPVTGFVPGKDRTSIMYGTCKTSTEGGCGPPVQVQTADLDPEAFASVVNREPGGNAVRCVRRSDERGVAAVDLGGGVSLFPASREVRIFSENAARAVTSLQTLDGSVRPGEPLSPTSSQVLATLDRACGPIPSR
jgi:hypothetical protein